VHLDEARLSEDLTTSHVVLAPGDLIARRSCHWVSLQCPGTPSTSEVDRCGCERIRDPTLAVPLTNHETGDSPYAIICPVLLAPAPDGPALEEMWVRSTRFDGNPANWLLGQVGHEARGRTGSRVVAARLLSQAVLP